MKLHNIVSWLSRIFLIASTSATLNKPKATEVNHQHSIFQLLTRAVLRISWYLWVRELSIEYAENGTQRRIVLSNKQEQKAPSKDSLGTLAFWPVWTTARAMATFKTSTPYSAPTCLPNLLTRAMLTRYPCIRISCYPLINTIEEQCWCSRIFITITYTAPTPASCSPCKEDGTAAMASLIHRLRLQEQIPRLVSKALP